MSTIAEGVAKGKMEKNMVGEFMLFGKNQRENKVVESNVLMGLCWLDPFVR